jgi:curved DNA-binding protein CbpA
LVTERNTYPGATPGSLYAVLGVAFDASDVQIKAAYHRQARLLHPDAVGDSRERTAQMADLNEAYATLVDPGRRADYDRGLAGGSLARRDGDVDADIEYFADADDVVGVPAPASPLSAAVAVCAALGGIFLGLSFALLSGGLAAFGALLLGAAGVLSGVRFRQAVQRPRDHR